jgi:hypothetical protein
MDLEHFDIAHYTGHKALDELFFTYSIYVNPIENVLRFCNIHTTRMNANGIPNANNILENTSIQELEIDNINHIDCFHIGSSLMQLRKKEAEFCINTAIYFQSMMEADINHLVELYSLTFSSRNPSFKEKWEKFLDVNNAPQIIKDSFDLYLNNIYRGIRNPAIHPDKRMGLKNPNLLRFSVVHENIMHGWFVFVFSLNVIHDADMDYDDNWNHMCQIHNIPSIIESKSFINIEDLSNKMYKKYTDKINENK